MNPIREYINQKYSVSEAYFLAFNTYPPVGNCFCPFHNNTGTPSAKVYDFGLKCWGVCGRVFSSYDILKTFAKEVIDKEMSSRVIPAVVEPDNVKQVVPPFLPGQDILSSIIEYLHEDFKH